MKSTEIKKLIASDKYNLKLHAYCDSYCDYCGYTAKCINFQILKSEIKLKEGQDAQNILFWHELNEKFAVIENVIKKFAETIGYDIDIRMEDNKFALSSKHKFFPQILRIETHTKEILSKTDDLLTIKKKRLGRKIISHLNSRKIISTQELIYSINEPIFWLTEQSKYKLFSAIDLRKEGKTEIAIENAKTAHAMFHKLILLWGIYIDKLRYAEIEYMSTVVDVYWTYKNIEYIFPDILNLKREYLDL